MVKFRSRLLWNWSSASWNILACTKSFFLVYVYKTFSQVAVFLGELLRFLCNHFSTIFPLPWDLNITFTITFTFVSSYLWRNKVKSCLSKLQNLFQDLSKKRLSTKKIHKIIVKAFFINTINEDYLNPIHIQKMLFSYHSSC